MRAQFGLYKKRQGSGPSGPPPFTRCAPEIYKLFDDGFEVRSIWHNGFIHKLKQNEVAVDLLDTLTNFLNPALAVTGTIRGSSKEKLYQELDLETLEKRICYMKLCWFFKIF